jgi:thiol-disulfide isomerase/thioredoxin
MKTKLVAPALIAMLLIMAAVPVLALLPTRQQAPSFSLPDYYSLNYHSLSDYRGKVVVIDFFGIQCGYCKEDSKNLATMYRTYYQRDNRVQFLCIESELGPTSVQDANYRAMVNSYVQYAGIPRNTARYTVLMGGQGTFNDYKCSATPTVYVLDKDGKIVKGFGYPITETLVKATVDNLLGSEPTPTPVASLSITNVQLLPGHTNCLMWEVTYSGSGYAAIAPFANLYAVTSTPPGYSDKGKISAQYVYDITTKNINSTTMSYGCGWAEVKQGHTYCFISGPVVPSDAKWALYNAQAWFDGKYHDSLYSSLQYTALR